MRRSNVLKVFIVVSSLLATVYLIFVLFGKTPSLPTVKKSEIITQEIVKDIAKPNEETQPPIKEHSTKIKLVLPEVDVHNNVCDMKISCKTEEIPFQVVSGAANIVGPSICVNGKWIMSNSIANVGRGLNTVVVDGSTGNKKSAQVFDVYASESTEFKQLVEKLEENDVVLIATYDDGTQKLRDDARSLLTGLGSENAKSVTFRDNWIFVGGKGLQKKSISHELHIKSDKDKNRFGNWPAALVLEQCLPKL